MTATVTVLAGATVEDVNRLRAKFRDRSSMARSTQPLRQKHGGQDSGSI